MDIFSRIARFYDKIIPDFNIEDVTSYIDFNNSTLILDMGGGTGRVGKKLLDFTNECLIVDYSLQMLQEARKKTNKLMLLNSDGENLAIKSNSIPAIFLNDTFHHLRNHQKALMEFYRILQKGGLLYIRDYDKTRFFTKLLILFEKLLRFGSKFFSPVELTKLCKDSAFSYVEVKMLSKSVYLLTAKK